MKKIMLLNQGEEAVCEVEYGKFSTGILELGNCHYVVNLVLHADGHAHAVALYRDVMEAAQAIKALQDFSLSVTRENQAFAMPQASEPVTALEVVNAIF